VLQGVSSTFDHALIMRDVLHRWEALPDLPVSQR